MSTPNDGGPAFPRPCGEFNNFSLFGGAANHSQAGMSLRDWFAGQALAGLTSDQQTLLVFRDEVQRGSEGVSPHIASAAYLYAGAMLKAREVAK